MRGEVNVAVNAWQHLRILVVKKIRYIVIHSVAAGVLHAREFHQLEFWL